MQRFVQSPTEPGFVQNPYPFYQRLRAAGDLIRWDDYQMPCAASHAAVHALLRDRRFGREIPAEQQTPPPAHLKDFFAIEDHSMLELEAPRHPRLRGLVLRAFTTRTITAMQADIASLCHELIDGFPDAPFDLLSAYCQPIPVRIICRLLGVPETHGAQLLSWSNAMVAMYQAKRDHTIELAAANASRGFAEFLHTFIAARRSDPQDDLITHLIAAEEEGNKLSTDELISTCILLLNAGHEATVHSLGNGIKTLIGSAKRPQPDTVEPIVEEILRFDPPLHMFTRYAYEPVSLFGHNFARGDRVGLLLASANRDDTIWTNPEQFDPLRPVRASTSFGGGIHFCVGAALARLEMRIALPILFDRCPNLCLTQAPHYADVYHFHGLENLMVRI